VIDNPNTRIKETVSGAKTYHCFYLIIVLMVATLEALIRRFKVPGQSWQKVQKSHLNQWLGAMAHVVAPATWESSNERIVVQPSQGHTARLNLKKSQQKKHWGRG
jgi:hypothetical protein